MSPSDALAMATLDTLPLNVAVLARDGEILHTNAAWREYACENGVGNVEFVGINYLSAVDRGDDEFARQAADGIRRVADGEQDLFTLEYPCHSPDERRWYLMRVSRFTLDGRIRVVVAHVDVTERKLAELEVAETAEELAAERAALDHLVDRIQGLLRDVTAALVAADSRVAIEQSVPTVLADAEPYDVAWIGTPDPADQELSPAGWAGIDDPPGTVDLSGDSPTALAYRERELQVVADLPDVPESDRADGWLAAGRRAVAAVPLVGGERCYGVLTLLADEPIEIDERERVVLAVLGRQVGTAIAAAESRAMLAADRVVELRVGVFDPSLYVAALVPTDDAEASYSGSVSQPDGKPAELYAVRGVSAADLAALADHREDVAAATVVAEHEDERLLEVVPDESLVARLTEFGAVTESVEADANGVTLTVMVADESDSRAVYEWLDEGFDGVELLAHGRRERRDRTATELAADLTASLTDRQHEALRKAYAAGFFEWPRPVDGESLATSMDVSRPTFHQHLRAAERKVLAELFDGGLTS